MGEEMRQQGSEVATVNSQPMTEGKRWGEPISDAREAELQAALDAWSALAEVSDRAGPFDNVKLTGADVFWLAEAVRNNIGWVSDLHLEGADLNGAQLQEADLRDVRLQEAGLREARLQGANLWFAQLQEASLRDAQLQGANLGVAHVEGADLSGAHLQGADLSGAHLQGADLSGAHLQGADLSGAHLQGADLSGVLFDSKSSLNSATLDSKTRLGDIQWGGVGTVNLTQINWNHIRRLGDERGVGINSDLDDHEAAVRAYRQLAAQLRAQGMAEAADRFAERAQVRQRKLTFRRLLADWRRPWRLPGDLVRWLFSWFLALLAGYGYHPGRSVCWYLAAIFAFAFAYYQATHGLPIGPYHFAQVSDIQALHPNEALVLSISSFHGRGFFQPIKSLGDPVATLAAGEAVIGLLIEISFIATFTQRFFSSK